jgi:sugar/nucleoside kinase (ribokinase family)
MASLFDVVGVGANSIDYVYRVPAHPVPASPTSKLRITDQLISPGGQTATTLCTCAAMGLRAAYVGTIGNDDNGRRMHDELSGRGIDVSHVIVRDAINPFAVILIDDTQGERVVLWDRDARVALTPADIDAAFIAGARLLHVDDVDEDVAIHAATMARKAGIPVTTDIERVTGRTGALVAAVTVPIFEEHALQAFTGERDAERGLRAITKITTTTTGTTRFVCVTLGSRGAMLLDGDRLYVEEGRKIDVMDTTGAGDIFRGAFIVAMLRGDKPQDILRFSNAAAALSCTRLGAIASVPTPEEVIS